MKRILICTIIASAMATTAMAQPRAAVDFQLQRITTNFISSPQFTYTGAEQYQADQRERWLEMEVTFASAPEFTSSVFVADSPGQSSSSRRATSTYGSYIPTMKHWCR